MENGKVSSMNRYLFVVLLPITAHYGKGGQQLYFVEAPTKEKAIAKAALESTSSGEWTQEEATDYAEVIYTRLYDRGAILSEAEIIHSNFIENA